jgi:hypothetical protein
MPARVIVPPPDATAFIAASIVDTTGESNENCPTRVPTTAATVTASETFVSAPAALADKHLRTELENHDVVVHATNAAPLRLMAAVEL